MIKKITAIALSTSVMSLCIPTFATESTVTESIQVSSEIVNEGNPYSYIGAEPQTGKSQVGATQSLMGVAIFVSGYLAGCVMDGVLIYSTGYSGAELSANTIEWILNWIDDNVGVDEVYVD